MADRIQPAVVDEPVFVWAAIGEPDSPPDRIKVESCVECGGLVRTDEFDRHGSWHARNQV